MLEQLVRLLESLQQTIRDLHGMGLLAFIGIFVATQALMIPVGPLGLAFGFFFGFWQGITGLMIACTIGAALNFLISRHLARNAVTRWIGTNDKLRLIDSAIGREGWRMIALLRFVPIPYGIANYCYGLTPVRFWPYLGATVVAIIPANSLFVWMGSTFQGSLQSLLGKGRAHHPLEYVFLIVGFLAAILALRHIAKIARNAVNTEAESP